MTTATEASSTLFEETLGNMRKASESALKMQQEAFLKWAKLWPGPNRSQSDWAARTKKFQSEWTGTVTELLQKHRETLDQQYAAGIESLGEAFQLAAWENPEEFRERCESFSRKTLDLMKTSSDQQMEQFKESMNKWVDTCRMNP